MTFQNIHTWGNFASTTLADKNQIALFEAWTQYDFDTKWSARLARQVISAYLGINYGNLYFKNSAHCNYSL